MQLFKDLRGLDFADWIMVLPIIGCGLIGILSVLTIIVSMITAILFMIGFW